MPATPAQRVEMIPIDRIVVVNPRIRNKRVFREIIDNIAEIGLKRPITVTRRARREACSRSSPFSFPTQSLRSGHNGECADRIRAAEPAEF